jgi:hypothetical protein
MVNDSGVEESPAADIKNMPRCATLQLKIAPDRIHYLKFILEGYDGLAILSTTDARHGLVEIHYPPETKRDLLELLAEVSSEIIN